MSFTLLIALGALFGFGFGFFVQRAGFCIAAGLGEMFAGRGKRILRLLLVVFIITSAGFMVSGYLYPDLGLKTIGQIRGMGFYNILSGLFFGAGIILCGGCILGTLRQIGEGNSTFIITLVSFIPGMALVVYVLDPLLYNGYFLYNANGSQVRNILLPDLLGAKPAWVTTILIVMAYVGYLAVWRKKRTGKKIENT